MAASHPKAVIKWGLVLCQMTAPLREGSPAVGDFGSARKMDRETGETLNEISGLHGALLYPARFSANEAARRRSSRDVSLLSRTDQHNLNIADLVAQRGRFGGRTPVRNQHTLGHKQISVGGSGGGSSEGSPNSRISMMADSSHSWKGFSRVGWGRSFVALSGTAFGRSERKGTTFCGDEEGGAAGPKGFTGLRLGSNGTSLALPEAG